MCQPFGCVSQPVAALLDLCVEVRNEDDMGDCVVLEQLRHQRPLLQGHAQIHPPVPDLNTRKE